jgi:hypothetical protein
MIFGSSIRHFFANILYEYLGYGLQDTPISMVLKHIEQNDRNSKNHP